MAGSWGADLRPRPGRSQFRTRSLPIVRDGGYADAVNVEQVVDAVRPHVETGVVPGAVIGILDGGREQVAAVGATEPGGSTPLAAHSVMRISSNTKPFIAALTVVLIEEGVVELQGVGRDGTCPSWLPAGCCVARAPISTTPCRRNARSPSRIY